MDFEELEKPDESDCCNSGCSPCILDLYEERKRTLQLKSKESIFNLSLQEYKNCVNELSYSIFKLISIVSESLSCNLYTFEYCRHSRTVSNTTNNCVDLNNLRLSLKPGQHLLLKNNRKQFTRAYTPIPLETNNKMQFTVLVKLYDNGLMSNYFSSLEIGAETLWRGPYGNFQINFKFSIIILIAQGTGIAPLYAIVKAMLENEECNVIFKLIYSCRSMQEIALHQELYYLCRFWNFTYELFLSDGENVSPKYNEIIHNNKLSNNYMQDTFTYKLKHKNNTQVLICGSEAFMGYYRDNVIGLGINKEHVVLFYIMAFMFNI